MDSTTIIAYCGLITSVGTAFLAFINRSRVRSHCCGKEIAADFTIDKIPATPPPATPRPTIIQSHNDNQHTP
jgi:hypothetical protein